MIIGGRWFSSAASGGLSAVHAGATREFEEALGRHGPGHADEYSFVDLNFELRRLRGFFFLNVMIPCVIFTATSYVGFFIAPGVAPGHARAPSRRRGRLAVGSAQVGLNLRAPTWGPAARPATRGPAARPATH